MCGLSFYFYHCSKVVGYAHCQYINRAVKSAGSTIPSLKQGLLDFDGTPQHVWVNAIAKANAKVRDMLDSDPRKKDL